MIDQADTATDLDAVLVQTAEQYRYLFFDMRDKWWAEEEKARKLRITVAKQREIIRNLELRLGVDQEL